MESSTEAFRDDAQRARVCSTLLGKTDLRGLWREAGPTERARQLFAEGLKELSSEKRTLFLMAWEIWREKTDLRFHDLRSLSRKRLYLVGSLLLAMAKGPDGVDEWLDDQ